MDDHPLRGEGRTDGRRPAAASRRRGWERRIVVDATVHHPIESVFPYLTDPLRWHDFAPAVEFRRQIDDGPVRVGTRWMATDRIGPFRAHFIDTLEELDEHRVVWHSSGPWNARVEYACRPSGAETRIRADYRGELGGALRWQVGWLPDWVTHHLILARDFRRLDRLLTRRARAARRWREQHGPASD
ncbi:SRPBCC family protein [Agromyces tropicus]|uniref:SRPBCC family protein n=1 Tax=Agromyces tropicus TaxID=555371 RepID=UPI0031E47E11